MTRAGWFAFGCCDIPRGKSQKSTFHEPTLERGIYAAWASHRYRTLKRPEGRAPVQRRDARPILEVKTSHEPSERTRAAERRSSEREFALIMNRHWSAAFMPLRRAIAIGR